MTWQHAAGVFHRAARRPLNFFMIILLRVPDLRVPRSTIIQKLYFLQPCCTCRFKGSTDAAAPPDSQGVLTRRQTLARTRRTPAAGVYGYSINTELRSQGATPRRTPRIGVFHTNVRNQDKDYAGYPQAHRASLRVSLRRCWLLCVWARHAQTPAASACSWYGRCLRRGAQSVYVGSFRARELRLRASRCNAAPISSDIVDAPLRSA